MLGHALAPTWVQLTSFGKTYTARPTTGSHSPGDTLRCKRSLVVPEYQPDVHRLRHNVLGLGPTNPEWTSLPQETLGFRRVGFSPTFRYSCRHSHSCPLQPSFRSTFTAGRTLPYHPSKMLRSMASVLSLAPLNFPRKTT